MSMAPIHYTHTYSEDKGSVAGGYLLKSYAPFYYTKRLFGSFYVYHKTEGFVVVAHTMRQVRNAMRAFSSKGLKTTEGIE